MEDYESSRPIYLQIIEKIKMRIILGEPGLGERLVSMRDMSLEMGVNPNTMVRVYNQLEREGVVETRRGMGTYVVTDPDLVKRLQEEVIDTRIVSVVTDLTQAGFTDAQIMSYVRKALERARR